jgi:dihydropteroate synthase
MSSFSSRPAYEWKLRTRSLALGWRTLVMGILNVTPDSFSDGGHFYDATAAPERAVERALAMLEEGADMIDIGGESTRPGALPLTPPAEQERVLPVIETLLRERPETLISIDSFHATTAQRAVEAGAEIVNDVSGGLWDAAMAATCAALRCGYVLMHARGTPTEWSSLPALETGAVMPMIVSDLEDRVLAATAAGIERAAIVIDPGLGFGKRGDENYAVLAHLAELHRLHLPVLVGASRKGFLAKTLAEIPNLISVYQGAAPLVEARGSASGAAHVAAILAGAHIIRVHDVQAAVEAAAIADRVLTAE